MVDRAPTKPNRYAVYDENHNFIRYEYHERADEPTQVGDALNKANLLPDAVATALGLTGNPQVKDALEKIKTLVDTAQTTASGRAQIVTGSYTGTGAYGVGNPNSLTAPFPPRLIVISAPGGTSNGAFNIAILTPMSMDATYRNYNFAVLRNGGVNNNDTMFSRKSGNTINWYASQGNVQMNSSGVVFNYMILG